MKFLTTSVSSCPWLGSDGRHFIRYESTIHLKLSLIMLIAIDKLMFMFDNWLLWPRLTKARLFFLIPIFFEMTKLMMTLQMLLMIVVNGAWQTRNTENLLANPSKLRSCHFSLQATQCFKSICIFHKRGICKCFGSEGHYAFRLQPLECSTAYYSDVRMGHAPFHAIEDGAMEIFKNIFSYSVTFF